MFLGSGRNRSTLRKPTHRQEQHANSIQDLEFFLSLCGPVLMVNGKKYRFTFVNKIKVITVTTVRSLTECIAVAAASHPVWQKLLFMLLSSLLIQNSPASSFILSHHPSLGNIRRRILSWVCCIRWCTPMTVWFLCNSSRQHRGYAVHTYGFCNKPVRSVPIFICELFTLSSDSTCQISPQDFLGRKKKTSSTHLSQYWQQQNNNKNVEVQSQLTFFLGSLPDVKYGIGLKNRSHFFDNQSPPLSSHSPHLLRVRWQLYLRRLSPCDLSSSSQPVIACFQLWRQGLFPYLLSSPPNHHPHRHLPSVSHLKIAGSTCHLCWKISPFCGALISPDLLPVSRYMTCVAFCNYMCCAALFSAPPSRAASSKWKIDLWGERSRVCRPMCVNGRLFMAHTQTRRSVILQYSIPGH